MTTSGSAAHVLTAHHHHPHQAATAQLAHRSLSRDDSLEYFIKFPVATGTRATSVMQATSTAVDTSVAGSGSDPHQALSAEAESAFMLNDTNNVPIVLLLGWAGCQDKYLMKYSKIYEDRG